MRNKETILFASNNINDKDSALRTDAVVDFCTMNYTKYVNDNAIYNSNAILFFTKGRCLDKEQIKYLKLLLNKNKKIYCIVLKDKIKYIKKALGNNKNVVFLQCNNLNSIKIKKIINIKKTNIEFKILLLFAFCMGYLSTKK